MDLHQVSNLIYRALEIEPNSLALLPTRLNRHELIVHREDRSIVCIVWIEVTRTEMESQYFYRRLYNNNVSCDNTLQESHCLIVFRLCIDRVFYGVFTIPLSVPKGGNEPPCNCPDNFRCCFRRGPCRQCGTGNNSRKIASDD